MKNIKAAKIFSLLFVLALLCSCSTIVAPYKKVKVWNERRIVRSIQESETEQKVFDGIPEPKMPSNWDNDSTLAGIDSNNDGVRDDVEIWINRRWNNPDLRHGFKQLSRAVQKMILSSDVSDGELKDISTNELDRAYTCLILFYGANSRQSEEGWDEIYLLQNMMTFSSWYRRWLWTDASERSLKLGAESYRYFSSQACTFKIINKYLLIKDK